MRGQNCEVLIFGDSTAMTGINPDLVRQQTGLRTCNIAITNAVLSVTGDLTLDHYLANNAWPRVILVRFSPEGFQQAGRTWKYTIYAEGLLEPTVTQLNRDPRSRSKHLRRIMMRLGVFFQVALALVFFRADSLGNA